LGLDFQLTRICDELISKDAPAKKKSCKEKTAKDSVAVSVLDASNGDGGALKETKEARKERKRLQKESKLALGSNGEAAPTQELLKEDPAAKAARKAEKAERKSLKKAKSQIVADSTTVAVSTTLADSAVGGGSYIPCADLTSLAQSTVAQFLTENFINITDPTSQALLRPIIDFSYLPITDPAQRAPFKGFKNPTPIQAAAWPFLLAV